MTSAKFPKTVSLKASLVATALAMLIGAGCSSAAGSPPPAGGAVAKMTFEECQASATSPAGGRYAVEFDNGVCKVQKP